MTFMYSTEYRFGGRGRISRSYTGVHAFIAIAFDVVLGLVVGLIRFAVWLTKSFVTAGFRALVNLFRLPFKLARHLSANHVSRAGAKPAQLAFDEL